MKKMCFCYLIISINYIAKTKDLVYPSSLAKSYLLKRQKSPLNFFVQKTPTSNND